MATLFTSDLHLGHQKVSEIRGFANIDDHTRAIEAEWEAKVSDDDIVYVLGDVSSGSSSGWHYALMMLAQLPGRKRLVNGNHDPCSSIHRKDVILHQRIALDVFESIQDFGRIRMVINGERREVLMSHYPYVGEGADHTPEARYTQYRLPDEGRILLHGHTHKADQTYHLSDNGTSQFHVGWDAHETLVNFEEIRNWIEQAEGRES